MSVLSASLMTGVMSPPSGIATAIATLMLSLYVTPAPSAVTLENTIGCDASATPHAFASSAVIVTPDGLSFLYSASSLSVSMLYATRNSGTLSDSTMLATTAFCIELNGTVVPRSSDTVVAITGGRPGAQKRRRRQMRRRRTWARQRVRRLGPFLPRAPRQTQ